jgi:ABC-2 type transport system permease protein
MPEPRRAFATLLMMQLTQLRGAFVEIVLATLVLPLGLVAALTAFPFATTPAQQALLLGASGVLPLAGIALLVVPGQIAHFREQGNISFFASFPVNRVSLLLAWLVAYGLVALPGVALIPLWTMHQLHVPYAFSFGLLVPLVLVYVTLAAIGACLGLAGWRHMAAAGAGVLSYAVSLFGLLFLTVTHPLPLAHTLATLLPATLATDLNAAAFPQNGTHAIATSVLLLLLYAAGFSYLAFRLLPWRKESQVMAAPSPLP